ncbi:MAG TPA: Rieske (2Fe-2S) protein [Verrucomicrobiales bacterium]|nr:Rieske (2Fe-2S) protein [Verrucomicrobiales bacterium]
MKVRIAAESELGEGKTVKFVFERQGRQVHGFAARFRGKIVAYENVCRHIPITIDYDDNEFFTEDGNHFICQTHGAVYEPLTGRCVRGPCPGERLFSLPVRTEGGVVWLVGEGTLPT